MIRMPKSREEKKCSINSEGKMERWGGGGVLHLRNHITLKYEVNDEKLKMWFD
jgi:hypothetical protein